MGFDLSNSIPRKYNEIYNKNLEGAIPTIFIKPPTIDLPRHVISIAKYRLSSSNDLQCLAIRLTPKIKAPKRANMGVSPDRKTPQLGDTTHRTGGKVPKHWGRDEGKSRLLISGPLMLGNVVEIFELKVNENMKHILIWNQSKHTKRNKPHPTWLENSAIDEDVYRIQPLSTDFYHTWHNNVISLMEKTWNYPLPAVDSGLNIFHVLCNLVSWQSGGVEFR